MQLRIDRKSRMNSAGSYVHLTHLKILTHPIHHAMVIVRFILAAGQITDTATNNQPPLPPVYIIHTFLQLRSMYHQSIPMFSDLARKRIWPINTQI